MKYKFYKKTIDTTKSIYFLVKSKKEFSILSNFEFTPKGKNKIQSIITGIEESKTKEKGEEFFWGSEDVSLYSNKNGVLLIDEMAIRGGEDNPEKVSLQLTHEEMLTFLNDFKKFVEENS